MKRGATGRNAGSELGAGSELAETRVSRPCIRPRGDQCNRSISSFNFSFSRFNCASRA